MFLACIRKNAFKALSICALGLGLVLWLVTFIAHSDETPALTEAPISAPILVPAPGSPPVISLEEGKQYHRVSIAVSKDPRVQAFIAQDPGKIQLIEFFSYGCYGCQQLHPVIDQWTKDKEDLHHQPPIVLYRIPLVFHTAWEPLAKAYYTAKILNVSEQLDSDFFTAVNQNHVDFSKENVLEDFVKVRGIDPTTFMDTYRSFGVNRQLAHNSEISLAYQITLSPFFVVNTPAGSFVTSAVMAGSPAELVNVLNYLVALKLPP